MWPDLTESTGGMPHAGVYLKFPTRPDDLRDYTPLLHYFEPASTEDKFILINLSRQFLGAYEHGQLVFSLPVSSGKKITKRRWASSELTPLIAGTNRQYFVKNSEDPYPMHYGLRFYVDGNGVSYWIHGRDMPGYPVSHGCVGLYDEEMQKEFYGFPRVPQLTDARKLFEWAISPFVDDKKFHVMEKGPVVWVVEQVK